MHFMSCIYYLYVHHLQFGINSFDDTGMLGVLFRPDGT